MPIGPAGRESDEPASAHGARHDAPAATSSVPAVLSMFGSLAVVIGLFLGLVWLLRRGSPKAARLLSSDVVEVLGRSPLAGRQQMHVIRFGNRLLLIAVSLDVRVKHRGRDHRSAGSRSARRSLPTNADQLGDACFPTDIRATSRPSPPGAARCGRRLRYGPRRRLSRFSLVNACGG